MRVRVEFIGDATLILGDCQELCELDWPYQFDSCVTDPPFGISYKSGYATPDLWKAGDEIEGDANTSLRDRVLLTMRPLPTLAFGSWRAPRPEQTRQVLIWDKGGALGMGALDIPWKPDHEEIYVLGKGFIGRRDSGSVIRCPPVQSMASNGRVHPNEKPVELMMRLCSKVPGTIVDPFMGSGSTGVAAIKLIRKFVGVEIVPEYFEIACERIAAAWSQPRLFADPVPSPRKEEGFV